MFRRCKHHRPNYIVLYSTYIVHVSNNLSFFQILSFHLQLVESAEAGPMDSEDPLYGGNSQESTL